MTKTKRILEALAAHGNRMPLPTLMDATEITARSKAESICMYLRKKGLVAIHRDRDPIEIELVPDGGFAAAPPIPRRPKKHRKTQPVKPVRRGIRTYRAVRTPAAIDADAARNLALDNYVLTAQALRKAVEHHVDGIADNPALCDNLAAYDRAERLLRTLCTP